MPEEEVPKEIDDMFRQCAYEAHTLYETAVRLTLAQEKAEPNVFKSRLILKTLWQILTGYLILDIGHTSWELAQEVVEDTRHLGEKGDD